MRHRCTARVLLDEVAVVRKHMSWHPCSVFSEGCKLQETSAGSSEYWITRSGWARAPF